MDRSTLIPKIGHALFFVAIIASAISFGLPWVKMSHTHGSTTSLLASLSISFTAYKGLNSMCVGIFCSPIPWVPSGEILDVFVLRIAFILGWVLLALPSRNRMFDLRKKPVGRKLGIIGGSCEIIAGIFFALGTAFFTVIQVIAFSSLAGQLSASFQFGFFLAWISAVFLFVSGIMAICIAKKSSQTNAVDVAG